MLKNNNNFILNTFLFLTQSTYPHGYEDIILKKMISENLLPDSTQKDTHGNYFLKIGESRTIFASHLDTVSKDHTNVIHKIEGSLIKTDGKTILGADDKAGVTIMLWMIKHNIPGLYYFFIGEEVGCIGSGLLAKYGDLKGKFDRIISFDRRGLNSVITHQSSVRTCSDEFAKNISKELNKNGMSYKLDDTGVYTDSAEFVDIIPECTNLSVGYYSEHTTTESQDIKHLENLAKACIRINWEELVTKRDIAKKEYKYSTSGYDWRNRDYDYGNYGGLKNRTQKRKRRKNSGRYYDDWYDQNTSYNNWHNFETTSTAREYYDGVDGLVDITPKKSQKKFTDYSYDWVMDKFMDKELNYETLELIKEQYLDMNNSSDRQFFGYLCEQSLS